MSSGENPKIVEEEADVQQKMFTVPQDEEKYLNQHKRKNKSRMRGQEEIEQTSKDQRKATSEVTSSLKEQRYRKTRL